MTQQQYIIRRKLNVLELGKTLGNISEACRKLGVSRLRYAFSTTLRLFWHVPVGRLLRGSYQRVKAPEVQSETHEIPFPLNA